MDCPSGEYIAGFQTGMSAPFPYADTTPLVGVADLAPWIDENTKSHPDPMVEEQYPFC
ncbi:hypothetical protein RvY_03206 [Ramazzottius varieornatus]|uniref:Uncharacterized protein n=1 Tax=Ramazzottius varieornatus TaxID=947166 RepID=A0A1D1UM92_RAMVA|nr:hypothetical protein RvY_03206 [Ramazzottius varieornatus]